MTVQMLLNNITITEFLHWKALYKIEYEERENKNQQREMLNELKKNRL